MHKWGGGCTASQAMELQEMGVESLWMDRTAENLCHGVETMIWSGDRNGFVDFSYSFLQLNVLYL